MLSEEMLLKSVPDDPKRFVKRAGDRSLTMEFIKPLKVSNCLLRFLVK